MGDILRVTINLTLICAVAGVLISGVWAKTDPVRLKMEALERELALKELMPDMDSISPVATFEIDEKEKSVYRAVDDGEVRGYVVQSMGRGYSSWIRMLVAVDNDNAVIGVKILGHGETPGLGDQITESWFLDRFLGKMLDTLNIVKKETDTEVQAISGATISSRAVNKGVRTGIEALVEKRAEGLDEMPITEPEPGPEQKTDAAEPSPEQ